MEEEEKSEVRTDLDSSTKGDWPPADEKEKEPQKSDSEAGILLAENDAEKEAAVAPSSEPVKADEKQGSPEGLAKTEETQAEEKIQTDAGDDDDIAPIAVPLNEEKSHKAAQKILSPKSVVSALLIIAVFSGFFIFDNKSKPRTAKKEELKVFENSEVPRENQQKDQSIHREGSGSLLDAKMTEINQLRDTLLRKQAEVLELKNDYQKGIDELEKEISDKMQQEGINTFLQAIENKRIEFALQTIQRRQIYIRKLQRPLNWIFEACEDLLYINRQALVDLQVVEIAAGIDLNKHMQQMEIAVEKYKLTANKLAIDFTETQPESLATIWERVAKTRLKDPAVQSHSKNAAISEQICKGDFEHLDELTEISPETAECVNRMQGAGLFLSNLTELSPAAARQLLQWNGSWMCLNGLRVLSPRAAHYLFQWPGSWISLNGLTEFSDEIGRELLHWNGNQLELMGLRNIENSPGKIGIEFLARWEQSGGKLFVPDTVRKKINAFKRKPEGNTVAQRN